MDKENPVGAASRKPKMTRMVLAYPAEFLAIVDEWRAGQPGVPNRSEAIRRLVEIGASRDAAPAPRKPAPAR